jgi:hypothetical protein
MLMAIGILLLTIFGVRSLFSSSVPSIDPEKLTHEAPPGKPETPVIRGSKPAVETVDTLPENSPQKPDPVVEMKEAEQGEPIILPKKEELKLAQEIHPEPEQPIVVQPLTHNEPNKEYYFDTKEFVYQHYHNGKSGAIIEEMLMCHAYAYHTNTTYGGSCGAPKTKIPVHKSLLGAIGLDEALPFQCPGDFPLDETIHRQVISREHYRKDDTRIWTPEYVDYLKSLVSYPPKPQVFTIAVHVRRGDVTPCREANQGFDRYLPNLHFLNLIEQNYPKDQGNNNVRVVVFSQAKSFEPLEDFSKEGYEVSIGDDLNEIWKTILTADVVILSRSDFSLIPAIVAQGKVVYTPFWHKPLRRWEQVDADTLAKTEAEMDRLKESRCQ